MKRDKRPIEAAFGVKARRNECEIGPLDYRPLDHSFSVSFSPCGANSYKHPKYHHSGFVRRKV
jgi:hypothetical protein